MPGVILIRKRGLAIQVADENLGPIPQDAKRLVESPLYYEYREMSVGRRQYSATTGPYSPISIEYRRAFTYDDGGRLCTWYGYTSEITRRLEAKGWRVIFQHLDPAKDAKIFYQDWQRVRDLFQFRPKQEECLKAIANSTCGVIDAAPAFGKMWIIMMVCVLYPNAKIAIVTKRRSIVDSIYDRLLRYVPNVGRVCSGNRDKQRVTVYTLDSLHHSDYDEDFVLVDEVHEAVTDRYTDALTRYWSSRIFGLSATINTRSDGLQHRIKGLCGDTIFSITQQEAEELGLVTPIVVYWLDIRMERDPVGNTTHPVYRKQYGIWTNDVRNRRIAQVSDAYFKRGMQVLITVDTVEHLLHLSRFLPDFEICYGTSAINDDKRQQLQMSGVLPDDLPAMTKDHQEDLRHRFERGDLKGVIATGVWKVGVSFDNLQVLVRADAGSGSTGNAQVPGRVCRTADGKNYGIVIDCNDSFNPTFLSASHTRRRDYNARGWQQFSENGKPIKVRRRCK